MTRGAPAGGRGLFAASAALTMLADAMRPEAVEHGGRAVGLATAFGFAAAFPLSALA